jgi:hypothetical protein
VRSGGQGRDDFYKDGFLSIALAVFAWARCVECCRSRCCAGGDDSCSWRLFVLFSGDSSPPSRRYMCGVARDFGDAVASGCRC